MVAPGAVHPALVLLLGLLLVACDTASPNDVEVAEGWTFTLVRDDLEGPTQLALTDDGRVLVAELAGGEQDGTGRVRDLGPGGTGEVPRLLLDGLVTPTGLAVVDDVLLVQEGRELVRWRLGVAAEGDDERTVLVGDLPWNGRSQGTLTLVGDGMVLHSATHEGTEPDLVPGSGAVYATPVDGSRAPRIVAQGFKVPYAHAVDGAGALWVTDVGDGRVDGEQVVEELHRFDGLDPTNDGGWPRCTGANVPIAEHGFTADDCASASPPVATFPPRSTPTGLAIADDGRVLVSLFTNPTVRGGVVEVAPDGTTTDVVRGLDTPQDLLALPDGSFLLTTHVAGQLHRLVPPS